MARPVKEDGTPPDNVETLTPKKAASRRNQGKIFLVLKGTTLEDLVLSKATRNAEDVLEIVQSATQGTRVLVLDMNEVAK